VTEGDAVIHELELPVPAERAFDMFTDPEQFVRWIGISAYGRGAGSAAG
jgi:uncharacterized protein YndB with AHSA1/START domain